MKKIIKTLRENAVRRGNFILSSGKKSNYYIDVKRAYTNPDILREIAKEMTKLIKGEEINKIAGIAVGAVPLATALSLKLGIPFLIIRKEKKGYGGEVQIEGELKSGEKVIIVEDVATSGASVLSGVQAVRENNSICNKVIAVVDREEGAREMLKKHNIELRALTTAKILFDKGAKED